MHFAGRDVDERAAGCRHLLQVGGLEVAAHPCAVECPLCTTTQTTTPADEASAAAYLAAQLDDLLTSFLADDGIIDSRVDGLNSSISDIADANVQLEYRAELLEKRYREQFNGLETLISGLTTTQSFLTQALTGLVEPNTTLK